MDAVACADCDLLHASVTLPARAGARCARCGSPLRLPARDAQQAWLAAALAASIAFAVANAEPLMRMAELGRHASQTLAGSALSMWSLGSETAAIVVLVCSIVAPAGYLAAMLVALLATRRAPVPRWSGTALRYAFAFQRWAMPEVVLLGTLVAYVKIGELAAASPGPGMVAIGALVLLMTWLNVSVDRATLWSRIPSQR